MTPYAQTNAAPGLFPLSPAELRALLEKMAQAPVEQSVQINHM